MGHRIVEANGTTQVPVQDAIPIVQILSWERLVKVILVAQAVDVSRSCAFAQHLLDRVAWNKVDEQKDQRDHKPDNMQCEDEAGQDLLHGLDSTINQPIVLLRKLRRREP